MIILKKSLMAIALLALVFVGCDNNSKNAIEFGRFESGTYKNDFFNLTVNVPESWSVLDDESRIDLMKKGNKVVAGEDDNLKATLNAADLENLNLLTASEHPAGAPVSFNPTFMIIAEKVKHLPGIVKGRDYHFHTKKIIASSEISVSYPKEIYETQIGGHTFDTMEMEIHVGNIRILQKQYAAITNGYALLFGLTYSNEMELEKLNKIVRTIELDL